MQLRQQRPPPKAFEPEDSELNVASERSRRLRANETMEVQKTRCTTPAYSNLPMCVPCSKNKHSEHCRFRKARLVARLPSGSARSLGTFCSGSGFSLSRTEKEATDAAQRKDASFILEHACRPLLELLDAEIDLMPADAPVTVATAQLTAASADVTADVKSTVDRSHLEGERQLCDWCGTTIMCLYGACAGCGYEACLQCTSKWASDGKPRAVHAQCTCGAVAGVYTVWYCALALRLSPGNF